MRYLLYCCLFSLFFSVLSAKLAMLIEIFRHGARGPIYSYWNAPSFNFPGELTSVGIRQHYLLGCELRREYIELQPFLSSKYDPREIYIRSSDYNRTIMSALSQLQGLYPLGTGDEISADIDFDMTLPPYRPLDVDLNKLKSTNFSIPGGIQPIPVHTVPDVQDRVMLGEHSDPDICPMNKEWLDHQKNSLFYKMLYEEFENNTIALLKSKLDINGTVDLGTVAQINDVFMNDLFANKPLPDLGEEAFKNITYVFTMNLFYTYYGSDIQRKVIPTPMLKEILSHLQSKVNNETLKKFVLFSGHDTTLGYLYTALNITNYECHYELWRTNNTNYVNCEPYPAYASNLIIELHEENEGEFFIKLKVNGKYLNVCDEKQEKCSWESFKSRVQRNLAYNYEEICAKPKVDYGFLNKEK